VYGYFKEALAQQSKTPMSENSSLAEPTDIFSQSDLETAIRQCNFDKGLGTDGLDCTFLKTNKTLGPIVAKYLATCLN